MVKRRYSEKRKNIFLRKSYMKLLTEFFNVLYILIVTNTIKKNVLTKTKQKKKLLCNMQWCLRPNTKSFENVRKKNKMRLKVRLKLL